MTSASTTIGFKKYSESTQKDISLSIEIAPKIVMEDGENVESSEGYLFGDQANIFVMTNADGYEMGASRGDLDPDSGPNKKVKYLQVENITFTGTKTGNTKHSIDESSPVNVSIVSGYSFFDNPILPVKVTGTSTIELNERFVGVLKVTYTSYKYHHKLKNVTKPSGYPEDFVTPDMDEQTAKDPGFPVVVVAHPVAMDGWDDHIASATVIYKMGEGVDEPKPYKVKIINDCTDEPVPGAVFEFQGNVYSTNQNGEVWIGELTPGSYSLGVITKDGYFDSDKDSLSNEGFTISGETDEDSG